jgi:RNA polymerase sigma-70 factor (ECF subfamily)
MAVGLEQDFDAFYAATHRRIVSHIYAMTGNLHEAEDCVQEAYARAWQRWSRMSAEAGNPEAWVRTVAARLAVSSWRKAVNRLKAHRREQRADEVAGMSPDHIAVVAALRKISPDQRMAIVLYHFAGLSIEEIAAETGVPPGTVKGRLSRGRKALAPHLTEFADNADSKDSANKPDHPGPPKFSTQPQPSGRGI